MISSGFLDGLDVSLLAPYPKLLAIANKVTDNLLAAPCSSLHLPLPQRSSPPQRRQLLTQCADPPSDPPSDGHPTPSQPWSHTATWSTGLRAARAQGLLFGACRRQADIQVLRRVRCDHSQCARRVLALGSVHRSVSSLEVMVMDSYRVWLWL